MSTISFFLKRQQKNNLLFLFRIKVVELLERKTTICSVTDQREIENSIKKDQLACHLLRDLP